MSIPAKIKIVLTAGDRRLQGMFALLRFTMAQKNSYDLLFGPSNQQGEIEVTRDQVLEEARKSMELFLMDYVDIERYWTGKLQVTPANRDVVQRALSAYRLFRRYRYPPKYEENLCTADATLAQFPKTELAAVVHCEAPDEIEVESIRVPTS